MEPIKITNKRIVYSMLLALIISLLFNGIFLNQNNSIKEEFSAEKLQTKALTQSREMLQREIVELESRISIVNQSTSDIQDKVNSTCIVNTSLKNKNSELTNKNKLIKPGLTP